MGGGIKTRAGTLNGVAYADDLTEVTMSRAKMQKRIKKVGEFLTWSGMGVNADKSHVMVVGRGGGTPPPLLIQSWDAMENKIKVDST